VRIGAQTYMGIMSLDLTDEETNALVRLPRDAIDGDRYPLSQRVGTLRAILGKLRPEPARAASTA
jgi:hypothetical protein